MKKAISILLSILMLVGAFSALTVSAEDGGTKTLEISGGTLEYVEENGGIKLTKFTEDGTETKITLPDEIEGKPVFIIGEGALTRTNLTELILPNGLKKIENNGIDCDKLKKLRLPDSLDILGEKAIIGCDKLTEIDFNKVRVLEDRAVSLCFKLKSVTLPKTLEKVGINPFYGCHALEEIKVAKDNTHFTAKDSVLFNKKLTTLYCYPRKKADKAYKVPDTVKKIKTEAFNMADNLKKLTLSESIKTLEERAVTSCHSLKTVVLGDGMKSLKTKFVDDCWKLSKVVIGKSLKEIDSKAVFERSGYVGALCINEYSVSKQNKYFTAKNGVLYNKSMTRLYRYAGNTNKEQHFTIPNSVKIVETYAFSGAYMVRTVTFGRNVEKLKYGAFAYMFRLDTINIPKKVTAIPEKCFYRSELESIKIPSNIKTVGKNAFAACYDLKKVTIAEGVKTIGSEAFFSCENMDGVKIPKSVTKIGTRAFGWDFEEDDPGYYAYHLFKIKGYKKSAAQKYATANELVFEEL